MSEAIPLCNSSDLTDGGLAVPFDVIYGGQTCRAFAIRFKGSVHAYLNRCSHVAMEMDFQPIPRPFPLSAARRPRAAPGDLPAAD